MSELKQAEVELLQSLLDWHQQNHCILLITVIRTTGHTPRRVGAQFALRDDGLFVGSVSGGCAEDDLINTLLKDFPQNPMTLRFGGNKENARSALSCGGEIELAVEPVDDIEDFQKILCKIKNGKQISRKYHLQTGDSHLVESAQNHTFYREQPWITLNYGSHLRLLIIGAVEISQYLAPMARMLNYRVEICDPRLPYQEAWQLNEFPIAPDYPDDWLSLLNIDAYCAIVALTHDPRYDDIALMEALPSDAFYVGVLGSLRSSEKRRDRLMQLDLKSKDINRLHGPVGIPISSRSSAEIAVSIIAHIIEIRNRLTKSD